MAQCEEQAHQYNQQFLMNPGDVFRFASCYKDSEGVQGAVKAAEYRDRIKQGN
jgi:hypothetical protein